MPVAPIASTTASIATAAFLTKVRDTVYPSEPSMVAAIAVIVAAGPLVGMTPLANIAVSTNATTFSQNSVVR